MSIAFQLLKKRGYVLLDHKGNEINLRIKGEYSIDYRPFIIIEDRNYFDIYLTDEGSIFGKKFHGIVVLGLDDVKQMGFALISIDMNIADRELFDDLPWFDKQRKIHIIMKAEDGIPKQFDELSTKPQDIEFEYNIKKKSIKVIGATASRRGYQEYSVGD